MFDEFRPQGTPNGSMLSSSWNLFGIEIVFLEVWESSINLRYNWNRFSKVFGADAGQSEGYFVS